ncbi:MAG TPA: helix-turn-helix transcriptional regulator [Polyangiaceae bacterium]|nr:helix-turn-helix transcriptional regulator [Polyangiaceae bacterium]
MAARRTSLARGGRAIFELCGAGLDSVSFRQQLRAQLRRLLPFDAYCVNTVDPQTRLITSSIGDGLSSSAARRLFELEELGTDFNRLTELTCVATLHEATYGDVLRSQRMRELFAPLGFCDELRAALVVDGHCWGYLHLFRESQPFTVSEVRDIEQVRSHVGAALRSACLVGDRRAALPAPLVVLLGRESRAEEWRAAFANDVGGTLPHPILTVAARVRHGALANGRYRSPRGDWLSLHGHALGEDVALTLSAPHARELAPLWFLAHGLSARERQVGALLLEGYANDAIANRLGISLYTAKDHVKLILHKTGAPSRLALLAELYG